MGLVYVTVREARPHAAAVAHQELGVTTDSVAKLVHGPCRESDVEQALPRPGYVVPVSATNRDEEALTGANAPESVVRIGNTVRMPWLRSTGCGAA